MKSLRFILIAVLGLLGTNALASRIAQMKSALAQYWEPLPEIFATSSASGAGREQLLDYIGGILKDLDNNQK